MAEIKKEHEEILNQVGWGKFSEAENRAKNSMVKLAEIKGISEVLLEFIEKEIGYGFFGDARKGLEFAEKHGIKVNVGRIPKIKEKLYKAIKDKIETAWLTDEEVDAGGGIELGMKHGIVNREESLDMMHNIIRIGIDRKELGVVMNVLEFGYKHGFEIEDVAKEVWREIGGIIGEFDKYRHGEQNVRKSGEVNDILKTIVGQMKKGKHREDEDYIYVRIGEEGHAVPKYILSKFVDKNGKWKKHAEGFIPFSIVLSGGVGPEGKGFAYVTPDGEVVEICGQEKQSQAIIVKSQNITKEQLIDSLRDKVSESAIDKIKEVLAPQAYDYGIAIESIPNVSEIMHELEGQGIKGKELEDVSRKMMRILYKVSMEDQFRTRMRMVRDKEIEAVRVPELVGLEGTTHNDILKTREFVKDVIARVKQREMRRV